MSKWLINPQQLKACYQQGDVVVVDCRFSLADPAEGERCYRERHIPGAHYLHLERDLSAPKGVHGGRHPLPELEPLVAKLRAIGVNNDTLIVAYDDSRLAFASRLWWLLRYLGHDRVKLLDGGFRAWCDVGLPVDGELPVVQPGSLQPSLRSELAVDIETVKSRQGQPDCALIDSRERERYLGLSEPIDPIAGSIDGAVNYPWMEVTDEQGVFKLRDQQQARLASVVDSDDIIVYCGSGVTACVNLLALSELGRDDARLYAGSWSDWCSYL